MNNSINNATNNATNNALNSTENKETAMNTQNTVNTTATSLNTTEATTMDTKTELTNSINLSLEETTMKDLTIDFSAFYAADNKLPEEVSQSLAEARAQAVEQHGLTIANRAEKALSFISLVHMLESVGGKETWLGEMLFNLSVSNHYWWFNKVKGEQITHGQRYTEALVQVLGNKDHEAVSLLDAALETIKGYQVDILEDGTINLLLKDKKELTLLKTFAPSAVKLSLQRTGIKVLVKKGTTITPVRGQPFVFSKNTAMAFGMDVINPHLENVLKSIRIHNEYTRVTKDIFELEVKSYTKEAYKFKREDALVMLLLLKENNVDLKELFKYEKESKGKLLILSRSEGAKGVKSLKRIVAPAHNFSEKYAMSGVTSLNDAKQGYVVPMVTIPRLVEFTKDKGYDVVVTRENVNKTINRFDKLNNAKALWNHWVKVFVVSDATTDEQINKALVGGNILVPNSFLRSNGVCRVVTDMDNGGIKASTTPFKGLDNELANGDTCVIASAGFKGGLLSALGLAYGDTGCVKNLFNIIEGSNTADPILNSMRAAVMQSMTTMVINGVEVQGVLLTLELKITNAYTVDSLMYARTKQEDKTSDHEKERVKQNIEDMLEEMETESKSSRGLRAYVAEQKAASSDLFSVYEWMKEGLSNGTLVKKPLITKVIAQEIQSIAHWYGKATAVSFLKTLLANQEEHGFDVDKLYAIQYLGAVEKEINKEVNVQDIVDVLKESTFKLTQDSSVYTKETMKDLLLLLGNSVYGWSNIVYQDGTKVALPTGRILVSDIEDQMKNDKSYVVAKGLINDLLENIKGMVKEDGTLYTESNSHLMMKALIQKPLLGKNFGYQYTKGYYGVALPMLGNYGVSTAGITNRNRMVRSDTTWETMTLSKAPQYFKGMTASYNVVDLDFGHELNLVLECAVFVNVEIVLMHQNDFDGDMYRITLGDVLPFVETIYNEFNGEFFKEFYVGELAGNTLDIKKAQQCYLNEYHESVHNAILAKDHIGSYTANSYFYEAMLPNLIGETFTSIRDKEVTVTANDAYMITSIMKMLIQVEAMDNVKQEGSSTYITEMLLHYKLRNLKGYNGMSDDHAVKNHLNDLVKELMKLINAKSINMSQEDVIKAVEIMYHVSKVYDTKSNTTALNLFNARNINEKAVNNVASFLSGEDYDNSFDFEGSFDSIIEGIDKESMYYEIIMQTVESLTGEDVTIRI